ncbi:MAG: hypothetical protein QXL16_00085 [Candidatus Micrarchaeaceae archaeon]
MKQLDMVNSMVFGKGKLCFAGKRLQSAMEYLTTYGWAILIIAIVLGVLVSLGLFSPGRLAPNQCLVEAGFTCLQVYLSANGLLTVNIEQTTSTPINVTGIECVNNVTFAYMQTPYNPPSNQININIGGNYTFSVFCKNSANGAVISGNPGSLFQGYFIMNYTDITTGFSHVLYGKISVKYS